jgi:hypothetical protein
MLFRRGSPRRALYTLFTRCDLIVIGPAYLHSIGHAGLIV